MSLRAVVTAGGTSEPIDDVRVVTNSSTGRMGAALAGALVERGVDVTLLASRSLASHPEWIDPSVTVVPFGSFAELRDVLHEATEEAPDLLFMAAAVSDYAPVPAEGKLSSDDDELVVRMVRNPKLLPTLRARCGPDTTLCGFKLLSGVSADELIAVARRQIAKGALDLCLANDLQELGSGRHPAWIVGMDGEPRRVEGDKAHTASVLADVALALHGAPATPSSRAPCVDLTLPATAGHAVADEVSSALDAAGLWLRTRRAEPWVERGWHAVRSAGGSVLLSPPSSRTDLRAAASVCLWHPASRRVLLGRRTAGAYHDYWAFPGGGVEPGDADRLATALRELTEETGVVVARDRPLRQRTDLVVGHGDRAWALHNVVVEVERCDTPVATEELVAEWVDLDQALTRRPMAAGTHRVLRTFARSLAER